MYRSTVFLLLLAGSQLVLATHLCTTSASAASSTQAPAPAPTTQSSTKTSAPPSAAAPSATSSGTSATPVVTPTVSPDSGATVASAAGDKPKKVWTNEEVTGISSTISVVGDAHNSKTKNSVKTPADPQYAANVRKELQKLQGQMADADKELASLKNFSEGEPVATADREFHKSYNSQPIDQQITNLQIKKKDLQSKIDALLDEARKKGVEPGQLR
jgi:hypothetical protein